MHEQADEQLPDDREFWRNIRPRRSVLQPDIS